MTEQPFERKHDLGWRKWLLLALLLALLAAMALASNGQPWQRSHHQDGAVPYAAIAVDGQAWVPYGSPLLLPDRRMRQVGETAEGVALFTAPAYQPGGGGGQGAPEDTWQYPDPALGPIYMRLGPDQYRRLMMTRVLPVDTPSTRH